jgi:hypothetical protein
VECGIREDKEGDQKGRNTCELEDMEKERELYSCSFFMSIWFNWYFVVEIYIETAPGGLA